MNYEFLAFFFAISLVNVVFATVKSLLTIKGTPLVASLTSAGYFAFYNIVLEYTVADFPMDQKCLITFICNAIGVYCVKKIEQKTYKDKLWKVEATILGQDTKAMRAELKAAGLSNKYYPNIGKYTEFKIFCETQSESAKAKKILDKYHAKYFVSESKTLT